MSNYIIENNTKDSLLTIGLCLTLFPYVVMLSLGALGHRLDIPFLFKFGFFECILVEVAAFPLRNAGFTRKVVRPQEG